MPLVLGISLAMLLNQMLFLASGFPLKKQEEQNDNGRHQG